MRSMIRLFIAIWLMISSASFAADSGGTYLRMSVDLDGDGKADVITMSLSGDSDFRHYTVEVDGVNYNGKFFAADGELPALGLLNLYDSNNRRLLLVTSPGSSACNYELLSYSHGRLVHLLSAGGPTCDMPAINNYHVTVLVWQGFWKRPETYLLNKQATKLTLANPASVPVNIPGYAGDLGKMQPANCATSSILPDAYVMVREYDTVRKRYLIKGLGTACGWVPERDMQGAVGGLPWGE